MLPVRASTSTSKARSAVRNFGFQSNFNPVSIPCGCRVSCAETLLVDGVSRRIDGESWARAGFLQRICKFCLKTSKNLWICLILLKNRCFKYRFFALFRREIVEGPVWRENLALVAAPGEKPVHSQRRFVFDLQFYPHTTLSPHTKPVPSCVNTGLTCMLCGARNPAHDAVPALAAGVATRARRGRRARPAWRGRRP